MYNRKTKLTVWRDPIPTDVEVIRKLENTILVVTRDFTDTALYREFSMCKGYYNVGRADDKLYLDQLYDNCFIVYPRESGVRMIDSLIEDALIRNGYVPTWLMTTDGRIARYIAERAEKLDKLRANKESAKVLFVSAIEQLEKEESFIGFLKEKTGKLKDLEFTDDGSIEFTFEDVYAEDFHGDGDEIYLGTLTFEVDPFYSSVRLKYGSEPRDDAYTEGGYHPHQTKKDGSICLGLMEADFMEALRAWDFNMVKIYLDKFAHYYNSADAAGEHWKAWTDEGYDEGEWSDYYDRYVPRDYAIWSKYYNSWLDVDNCVYSEILGEYIPDDDAVELENGGGWMPGDHTDVCEYDGDYYHIDDMCHDWEDVWVPSDLCVFSEILYAHILREDAVELENNAGWMPIEHDDVIEYNGGYYYLPNCKYSEALGIDIPEEFAIEHEGDWYTEDTLPKQEENEEVQEDI